MADSDGDVRTSTVDLLRTAGIEVPPSVDERAYAKLLIAVRRGQRAFRQGLLPTFDRTRCISASRVEEDCAPAGTRLS